jgi:hypothetical protein
MIDMKKTIVPKSDQLNADDLIGGAITITITKVSMVGGDQPIAISYEGDNGKPWKPCKGMRRMMVLLWGGDGSVYAGRSMTLFRNEKVKFGGFEVGGIQISHMSHISEAVTVALTASKASRKPFTVRPLEMPKKAAQNAAEGQSSAAIEYITLDQQTVISDLLGKNEELRAALLKKAGCESVATMRADVYAPAMKWLKNKLGE